MLRMSLSWLNYHKQFIDVANRGTARQGSFDNPEAWKGGTGDGMGGLLSPNVLRSITGLRLRYFLESLRASLDVSRFKTLSYLFRSLSHGHMVRAITEQSWKHFLGNMMHRSLRRCYLLRGKIDMLRAFLYQFNYEPGDWVVRWILIAVNNFMGRTCVTRVRCMWRNLILELECLLQSWWLIDSSLSNSVNEMFMSRKSLKILWIKCGF